MSNVLLVLKLLKSILFNLEQQQNILLILLVSNSLKSIEVIEFEK